MPWLHPIFIDLTGQPVIVIGGGTVAERKIDTLLEAGASLTVVSPEATPLISRWAEAGRLVLEPRPYQAGDLRGFRVAYAATSIPRSIERFGRRRARMGSGSTRSTSPISATSSRRPSSGAAISPSPSPPTGGARASRARSGRTSRSTSGPSTRTSSRRWAAARRGNRPTRLGVESRDACEPRAA